MKCKYCHNDIIFTHKGIISFCDDRCKKLYNASIHAKNRTTEAISGSNSPEAHTIPLEDKALKTKIREEFGGEEWYNLAKKECCNFEVKCKSGYCVTLFSPCSGFRCKCSECEIGLSLKRHIEKSNKKDK